MCDGSRFDDDRGGWHVTISTKIAGADIFDAVDNIGSLYHFAKDGIPPAIRSRVIERGVVCRVDEKLRRSRMRFAAASHGYGIDVITQAVGRFVTNRSSCAFFLHVAIKSATLNHETGDDAMKNRATVLAAFYVLEKILYGERGLFRIEFQNNIAHVCLERDFGHIRCSIRSQAQTGACQSHAGC